MDDSLPLSAAITTGLVSVIVPVFNRPALVRSAVESALAQIYPQVEVIVVDDGSTDETPQVLEALCREHPDIVRVLRIPNGGPGVAREVGRQASRGEFIQYLDSDDSLLPNKLAAQVSALRRDTAAGICNGPTLIDRGTGSEPKVLGERLASEGPRTWFPGLMSSRHWTTGTPLYRRRLTDRAGAWEGLRMYEDWVYEAAVARLRPLVCYVNEPMLSVHRAPLERLDNIRQQDPREHLRYLAIAQARVFRCARGAGVTASAPEFRSFVHHLLATSTRCAEVGLGREALQLAMLGAMGWVKRPAPGMALPLGRAMVGGLRVAIVGSPR